MARKKGFTDDLNNPALGFISGTDPEAQQAEPATREEALERLKAYAEQLGLSDDYRIDRAKRTHRVQLILTETLFSEIREFLKGKTDPRTGRALSMNEWANQVLQAAIDADEQTTMER